MVDTALWWSLFVSLKDSYDSWFHKDPFKFCQAFIMFILAGFGNVRDGDSPMDSWSIVKDRYLTFDGSFHDKFILQMIRKNNPCSKGNEVLAVNSANHIPDHYLISHWFPIYSYPLTSNIQQPSNQPPATSSNQVPLNHRVSLGQPMLIRSLWVVRTSAVKIHNCNLILSPTKPNS